MPNSEKWSPAIMQPENDDITTWELPENAIARLGHGIEKSNGPPRIALPSRGGYFAVASGIGLWWYEMSSSAPIALWETERGLISAVDFSQDNEWIAIANYDGIIKVVDVQSGECLSQMKPMEEHNIYWYLDFSPDSKWIATANWRGIVEVLDVHRGVRVAQMNRGNREVESADVYQLEFSPSGQYVAATADNLGTEGTQTYIWDPETGVSIFKFSGRNFAFSQDSRLLAGVTSEKAVNDIDFTDPYVSVWNIAASERVACFRVKNNWLDVITFSPCGECLALSSKDESLYVWDLVKGEEKKAYTDFQTLRTVPFYSTEGELFAIVDREDTIEVWNIERNEKIQMPELHPRSIDAIWLKKFPQMALADIHANITPDQKVKFGNIHTISTLREPACFPDPVLFLPDGETLATRGHRVGVVLWDVERKQVRETLLKDRRITSFTVLPSGNILAAHSQNNVIKVWDAERPDAPIAEFTETEQARLIWNIAFAPTGDRLAVGSREGTIYLYDFKCKNRLKPLKGHTEHIWSVAFSPDGKRLVSGSDDGIARLWNVESGEEIATLPLDEPRTLIDIVFSPCGTLIAGGLFGELRLWCAETLTTLYEIPQPQTQKPYALTFSPCGKYLASGTWWERGMKKMAIRLWDVTSGENIATLCGHPTDIQSLAFSPEGTLLATGSFDCSILLWDLNPLIDS